MDQTRPTALAARLLGVALAGLLTLTTLASCGSGPGAGDEETLTVFAAASLTGTFTELGARFEAEHPGVRVRFNFGGSADLVAQLRQGAPADVVATADPATLQQVVDEGLAAGAPAVFATNTLTIVTPPDDPGRIRALTDLTRRGVALVVCAPQVPCGTAAATVARNAGLELTPVSEEQSVKDVLAKVVAGEADAGLVYVTDAAAAGETVRAVAIPAAVNAVNPYPIATLTGSRYRQRAAEFVALVRSDQGRAVLRAAGFGEP